MVQLANDKITINDDTYTIYTNNSDSSKLFYDTNACISNKFIDFDALKFYDKKIKEYIDEKINKTSLIITESKSKSNKYKVIYGED